MPRGETEKPGWIRCSSSNAVTPGRSYPGGHGEKIRGPHNTHIDRGANPRWIRRMSSSSSEPLMHDNFGTHLQASDSPRKKNRLKIGRTTTPSPGGSALKSCYAGVKLRNRGGKGKGFHFRKNTLHIAPRGKKLRVDGATPKRTPTFTVLVCNTYQESFTLAPPSAPRMVRGKMGWSNAEEEATLSLARGTAHCGGRLTCCKEDTKGPRRPS